MDYQYNECRGCGAYQCVTQRDWTHEMFAKHVYNDGYVKYDGDIDNPQGNRPTFHYKLMHTMFQHYLGSGILDYGSGKAFTAKRLADEGVDCRWYDPYHAPEPLDKIAPPHFKFSLITAFEVLEHVYDIVSLFNLFNKKLHVGGVVYATTDIMERNTDVQNNYYTCPRVGHVVLHTSGSLQFVARRCGFMLIHLPKDIQSGIQGHLFIKQGDLK